MMKSRIPFFMAVGLLILGIALFTFFTRNQVPAQTFAATVNRDCAPWDGSAFRVAIPMSDGTSIDISIWKAPDIKFPVTFSFPDNTGQLGNASLISTNGEYDTLSGEVWFRSVGEGKPIEGRFRLKSARGGEYIGQFEAQWGNQVMMCG